MAGHSSDVLQFAVLPSPPWAPQFQHVQCSRNSVKVFLPTLSTPEAAAAAPAGLWGRHRGLCSLDSVSQLLVRCVDQGNVVAIETSD